MGWECTFVLGNYLPTRCKIASIALIGKQISKPKPSQTLLLVYQRSTILSVWKDGTQSLQAFVKLDTSLVQWHTPVILAFAT